MPRASYGDKHTVSVMQGQNHVVLDFTSKVIDFVTLTWANETDTEEERAGMCSMETFHGSMFGGTIRLLTVLLAYWVTKVNGQ